MPNITPAGDKNIRNCLCQASIRFLLPAWNGLWRIVNWQALSLQFVKVLVLLLNVFQLAVYYCYDWTLDFFLLLKSNIYVFSDYIIPYIESGNNSYKMYERHCTWGYSKNSERGIFGIYYMIFWYSCYGVTFKDFWRLSNHSHDPKPCLICGGDRSCCCQYW